MCESIRFDTNSLHIHPMRWIVKNLQKMYSIDFEVDLFESFILRMIRDAFRR
jgi:hypothetical protein